MMHPIEAQNKARLALLDTLEPVCQEVDAIDIALQHYHQVLAECGYCVAPVSIEDQSDPTETGRSE